MNTRVPAIRDGARAPQLQWVARAPGDGAPCRRCRLAPICLPSCLDDSALDAFAALVRPLPPLQKGQLLYRAGAPFENLYAVRTGALKGVTGGTGTRGRIVRFFLPGEVVGFGSIDSGVAALGIFATDTAHLCAVPYTQLEGMAQEYRSVFPSLVRRIGRELRREQQARLAFAAGSALPLLATTLLELGARFAQSGLSPTRLRLPMARLDLGDYLGLTPETVSRTFAELDRRGWITSRGREVELLDLKALRRVAPMATF